LDAGVHFGHQTKRWNPKMKQFIFDARNGIHIIDLSKTATQLQAACNFLSETVRKGQSVLFVGTKKQAQLTVKETAKECGQMFVCERWLGGTLTNYSTLKKSIARLKEIEKMEADGSINQYVKQEQSMIRREAARLVKYLDGIRTMDKMPGAMFVVDLKREHNAVAEARKLKIPVVAIVDTNCDPNRVDFPIPSNDDATKSIAIITEYITAAIAEGLAERQAAKDDDVEESGDDEKEKKAARMLAEAEAEASRGGGGDRGRSGSAPKRRVPGGASRRPGGPR